MGVIQDDFAFLALGAFFGELYARHIRRIGTANAGAACCGIGQKLGDHQCGFSARVNVVAVVAAVKNNMVCHGANLQRTTNHIQTAADGLGNFWVAFGFGGINCDADIPFCREAEGLCVSGECQAAKR